MKILFIHNEYAKPSGEEHASGELAGLLREHGHEVRWFKRSSAEITGPLGKLKSFFTGIYNPSSKKSLSKVLDEFEPDIVQVQNLYPLLSISIFEPLRRRNLPVVMRCPNYRLFCPEGLCLNSRQEVCEKCWGGHESQCIVNNCMGSRFKSIGYALRNAYARRSGAIRNGVDCFIVQSRFQQEKFETQGIPSSHIGILPGISPDVAAPQDDKPGACVGFVGRVSKEKGIDELIEAARILPDIPFRVAGNLDDGYTIPEDLPANVEFVGFRKGAELDRFYLDCRLIVVPSKWYEGFPNVILRGMMLRRPVISTAIGAMTTIIDSGRDGILIPPADAVQLADAIRGLYDDAARCNALAEHAYRKATSLYGRQTIYNTLLQIYEKARKNAADRIKS